MAGIWKSASHGRDGGDYYNGRSSNDTPWSSKPAQAQTRFSSFGDEHRDESKREDEFNDNLMSSITEVLAKRGINPNLSGDILANINKVIGDSGASKRPYEEPHSSRYEEPPPKRFSPERFPSPPRFVSMTK